MTALLTLVLGRDDNNSSLKWFTYGERLKRGTSVRDWHDTNSATAIEWPAQLVSYFANKPDQSPAPKRKATSKAGALFAKRPAVESAAKVAAVAAADAAACAAADAAAARLWYKSQEPRKLEPTGLRARRVFLANDGQYEMTIDLLDYESKLTEADEFALFALFKRAVANCPVGSEEHVFTTHFTLNNSPLKIMIERQRKCAEQGSSSTRYYANKASACLTNAGGGDISNGFVMAGKRNLEAFKNAAKVLNVAVLERLSSMDGLEIMADCGFTWTQYRKLNSILLDKFDGTSILATECGMRKFAALQAPIVVECDKEMLTNRRGDEVSVQFCRATDLFDAIEKEFAALVDSDRLNKELDAPGSPFAQKIALKFLGDKGGRSTKFGFTVINGKDPNSPKRFIVLCDFEGPVTCR
jgi:hypothetical protein